MYERIALLKHHSLVDLRYSSLLGLDLKSWLFMPMLDCMTLVASHSIDESIPINCCNPKILLLTISRVVVHWLSIALVRV